MESAIAAQGRCAHSEERKEKKRCAVARSLQLDVPTTHQREDIEEVVSR
jgi:hypothetical protein